MGKKKDKNIKAIAQLDKEGTLITSVSASPAELLAIIQSMVNTFAEAAGISYDEVLRDLQTLKIKEDI